MELIKQIDETISFNENNVRIIGTYHEPWFVAKDVCNILELKNITEAMKMIPEKWRGSEKLNTFGGEQNMNIVNEAGLYKLIMRSNKPIAQKFQEAVCEDILPSLRKKGEYKIQSIIDKNKQLEDENKEKDLQIKSLEDKIIDKQKRVQYKDKNCIYILTTDFHLQNRTYIIGESVDLTHRLSSYNKSLEHTVVFTNGCKSVEHMHVVEKMVLYKLDKYREKANRDRYILPENKDISFFINVINNAISWFDDIEEYVHKYNVDEIGLTSEQLQEKYIQNIKEHDEKLKNKKSETDRTYRENNKEKKADIDKIYRENNTEKIAEHKKEYYENNKTEILNKQKEYYNTNKDIINQVCKTYREENKEKIKEQKEIYRKKYKEEINRKQKEKRREKPNHLIECECGIKLKLKTKKHLNSKAHIKYIQEKMMLKEHLKNIL